MRSSLRQFILFTCLMALASGAAAQGRVPATDSGAIGGDVGFINPPDDALGSGPVLEGFYEYYFRPRVSIRVGLGWSNPSIGADDDDTLRTMRVPVDVVYNWEGGAVHPFVGAGLGIYFVQRKENGESLGDSRTKVGTTIFGGIEYFLGRTLSLKGEGRYHIVDLDDEFGVSPEGLALTVGLKKYF